MLSNDHHIFTRTAQGGEKVVSQQSWSCIWTIILEPWTSSKNFTCPDSLRALLKEDMSVAMVFFCSSGTLLVTCTWISPLLTPWRGIHLLTVWFGGKFSYSTKQSPMFDVGSKALWSFTCKAKRSPVSGNSRVWFHWGFSVLWTTCKACNTSVLTREKMEDKFESHGFQLLKNTYMNTEK